MPGGSSGIVTQPRMSRFPSCTAKPGLLMFCLPWSSGGRVGAPGNQRERTTSRAGRGGVRCPGWMGHGGIPGAEGRGVGDAGGGHRSGLQHEASYPKNSPRMQQCFLDALQLPVGALMGSLSSAEEEEQGFSLSHFCSGRPSVLSRTHWVRNGTSSSLFWIEIGVGGSSALVNHPGQEIARFSLFSDFSLLMPKTKLSIKSCSMSGHIQIR